jgi:hypothetical protein
MQFRSEESRKPTNLVGMVRQRLAILSAGLFNLRRGSLMLPQFSRKVLPAIGVLILSARRAKNH